MSREALFAHILTGDDWTVKHVHMLLEEGFVNRHDDISERYIVVKEFPYLDMVAKVGDLVATCPGEMPNLNAQFRGEAWPEVLLLPKEWM